MKKMETIANISFGINNPPDKNGDVPLIQAGSISNRGGYIPANNGYVLAEKLSENNYLSAGDLLFAAKGVKNIPYVIKHENLPAAASSIFFIIRAGRRVVRPEYLAWYLKSQQVRQWINTVSGGSTIASISIREFRKLKVPVPSLRIQKKIIELQDLQNQYRAKADELVKKVESLNDELARQIISNK